MKIFCTLVNLCAASLLLFVPPSGAEVIYLKDGSILKADITGRSRKSIWISNAGGSTAIKIKNIKRIENSDGSISKYDYSSLGSLIEEMVSRHNYKKAEEACSILLESFPDDVTIRYLRAMLSQKNGDFSRAIEDYNFLIKKRLGDDKIFNNLGVIYAKLKEHKLAQESFARAIAYNSGMVEAHNNLADLALQINDYDRAITEYSWVLEKEPKNITALYNLGLAYMSSGDSLGAQAQWQKAFAINPENADVKSALAKLEASTRSK
ncbi:MAG: tetratricopeptide repeat protein [Candidatus Omnitrophica bacterium]|nr:tetratricopeptide repeat protein [Candidatus Omnitrophota bacterium]